MAERRSMASALTPEKIAFLKGDPPEPHPSVEEQSPQSIPENMRMASPAPAPVGRERVTVTVRLEPDVVAALVQASAERKVKRLHPHSQQDIVGDALKLWLRDAGFWPPR
jgi:hypothetical protein